jgi:hypothetical protein
MSHGPSGPYSGLPRFNSLKFGIYKKKKIPIAVNVYDKTQSLGICRSLGNVMSNTIEIPFLILGNILGTINGKASIVPGFILHLKP